jgi:asparagine synthase (glutamine-hydrolysing)
MCGIAGIINFDNKPVGQPSLRKMMQAMKHRGPDDEGVFTVDNVGLGFVRLSIIDLTISGHQPMIDASSRYVIVFNGEIYNYIELREDLKKEGVIFRTHSDTEVLLNAYIHWGQACLNKFNGMWAFAIYDTFEKSVFFSRDRFGVKPFYYYADNEFFVFASDIPAILSVLRSTPEPDNHTIYEYMLYNRTDQDNHTFYKGIKKLQHGCNLTVENNNITVTKWYNLRDNIQAPFQNPDEYSHLFTDAVGLRLRSDVPIGVCLSGGLDSSAIVSVLLKKYNKNDVNTFSATFGNSYINDETGYINEFEPVLKNMYFTQPDAYSLKTDISSFIKAHSEPLPTSSPYAQFKVMQLAKDYVTVLLDGQGADEQLAGYHYFFGFYYKELLQKWKLSLLAGEIYSYCKTHKSLYGLQSFGYLLLPARIREKYKLQSKSYLNKNFVREYTGRNITIDNLNDSPNLKESLINHFEYKLEHLLKWEDRNSMWFSLEARVPFLDYRLVEKTLALPSDQIIRKGETKYIFRESMRDILPDKIRTRHSKIGFITPDNEWFRTSVLKDFILELLNSREFARNPYIDQKMALKLYNAHLSGKTDISTDIWKWMNLTLWLAEYIR